MQRFFFLLFILLCSACSRQEENVLLKLRLEGDAGSVDTISICLTDSLYRIPVDELGSGEVKVRKNSGKGEIRYLNCSVPVYVGIEGFEVILNVFDGKLKPAFSGKGMNVNYDLNCYIRRVESTADSLDVPDSLYSIRPDSVAAQSDPTLLDTAVAPSLQRP